MEKKCELKIVFGRVVLATGKICLFTRIFWRSDILLGIGFLHRGRGLVACKINTPINGYVNWSVDTIKYDRQFISQLHATAYLQQLELEENTVSNLLSIIASYEPKEAIYIFVDRQRSD